MKEMFGEEAIGQMIKSMNARFPESQVGVGDTWGGESKVGGPIGMLVKQTFKMEDIQADRFVMSVTGTISTDPNGGIEMGGMRMEYNLDGTQDGTMELDRKTGMVVKSTLKQKIQGSVKTMGMEMPMTIDQTVEVMPY
jgi:hypothetical protein